MRGAPYRRGLGSGYAALVLVKRLAELFGLDSGVFRTRASLLIGAAVTGENARARALASAEAVRARARASVPYPTPEELEFGLTVALVLDGVLARSSDTEAVQ
jgi:hypothetical protein